jgi:hypothetical protein
MPAVVDVVFRDDDDGQPGVRVVVEIHENPGGNLVLVFGERLGRSAETTGGKDALGGYHGVLIERVARVGCCGFYYHPACPRRSAHMARSSLTIILDEAP